MKKRSSKFQSGFNLIELMIAIVIGLFISLMVVQYLVTSSKLFKQQGADTNLVSQFVRQAGSHDPLGTDIPFHAGNCDGDDPNNADNPCTYNTDVLGESDQMAVQLFPYNLKDCTGRDVDEDERIANVFFVEDNTLHCRGYNVTLGNWQPGDSEELVDGIEQFQVLYGLSNDSGQVDRYVDAKDVTDGAVSDTEKLEAWDRVRSVKLALLVSDSENAGTERSEARTYQLLDSPPITITDRVSRKVYSTTVTINNKLL